MSPLNSPSETWRHYAPLLNPPIAAALAIIPPYWGMIAKSELQMGRPYPRMTPWSALKQGIKASPAVGLTVGTQLLAQRFFEEQLMREEAEKATAQAILASTTLVSLISVPALAVINGQTMGWSPLYALRQLSVRQGGAIVGRELSFLMGIRAAEPACEWMKGRYGDRKAIALSGAFFSGMLGSALGHPGDTLLTWAQKGIKPPSWQQLMRGSLTKSVAVGVFAVLYQESKQVLNAL